MNLLKSLVEIETQRRNAWITRDKAALSLLLDDDFLELNYFGRLSKSDILNHLFDRLFLEEFTIEEPAVMGTPASPVLVYACSERLLVNGKTVEGRFHVASHFIQRACGWKILLWQITPCKTDS